MVVALISVALIACTDVQWGSCGPSPDRRCSLPGRCCSTFGYCGVSARHCAGDQQAAYSYGGSCSAQASTPAPSPPPPPPPPPALGSSCTHYVSIWPGNTDAWCNSNCFHNPPHCPSSHCQCDAWAAQTSPPPPPRSSPSPPPCQTQLAGPNCYDKNAEGELACTRRAKRSHTYVHAHAHMHMHMHMCMHMHMYVVHAHAHTHAHAHAHAHAQVCT